MDEKEMPPELEQYLSLAKRIYERMERENSWPWVVDPEGWAAFEARKSEQEQP